jgi:hypothetical protein
MLAVAEADPASRASIHSKRNALKERREKEAEKLRLQQLAEKVSPRATGMLSRLDPVLIRRLPVADERQAAAADEEAPRPDQEDQRLSWARQGCGRFVRGCRESTCFCCKIPGRLCIIACLRENELRG